MKIRFFVLCRLLKTKYITDANNFEREFSGEVKCSGLKKRATLEKKISHNTRKSDFVAYDYPSFERQYFDSFSR